MSIVGRQSLKFKEAPYIYECASVVGKKEGEGPLGQFFDRIFEEGMCGCKSWEEAESFLQKNSLETLLAKSKMPVSDIRYIFSGDLLGQLIATSFGVADFEVPLFGLYGACSTYGEGLSLSAMCVAAGYCENAVAMASSHFASAEKQFRFPLGYGNQRPLAATYTVTGAGSAIVSRSKGNYNVRIKGVTTGRIVDYGVKDSMNMGACMAPAAADTIEANLRDFNVEPDYYDKIITGDLGSVGHTILCDLLMKKNIDIRDRHMDCGIEIFTEELQDTHAGGSGCGCSAVTFNAYIMRQLNSGQWKRVLFVPTGALLSPVSYNEGKSVPGIAHGVVIEHADE